MSTATTENSATVDDLTAAREHVRELEAQLQRGDSTPHRNAGDVAAAPDMPPADVAHAMHAPALTGVDALREEPMMRHLLEALERGDDIGHYGRLTFCMVARHFLTDDELLATLTGDGDLNGTEAATMLAQVKDRNYSPPRRDRILEWQREQSFAIVPDPEDPDCGNVYRTLHFPQRVYDGIEHYREDKMEAAQ